MRYIHQGLEMSNAELEKAKREEKRRILLSGRLVLVLDLDHTLLNSARFSELSQEEHYVMHRIIAAADCEANGGSKEEVQQAAAAIQPVEDPGGGERQGKEGRADEMAGRRRRRKGEGSHGPFPGTDPPLSPQLPASHGHVHKAPAARARVLRAASHCAPCTYTPWATETTRGRYPGSNRRAVQRTRHSGDSTSQYKKDLDIVLGAEPTVLITDDTDRVWPKNIANLIRIDRYHFFKQSAAGFRQPGRSVMERQWRDEGDNGDRAQLRDVLAVIAAAHRRFFEGTAAANTANDAIAEMDASMLRSATVTEGDDHRETPDEPVSDEAAAKLESRDVRRLLTVPEDGPLANVRVVFSRVVAQSEPRPERHPLWLLATALGAEVLNSVDDGEGATHVVAHAGGDGDGRRTDKVKWAASASAVSADCRGCADEWARVDESRYSLLGPDDGGKVRDAGGGHGRRRCRRYRFSPGSPGYSA